MSGLGREWLYFKNKKKSISTFWKRVTKFHCIIHELGLNIINCRIGISHYLANRIFKVPSFEVVSDSAF